MNKIFGTVLIAVVFNLPITANENKKDDFFMGVAFGFSKLSVKQNDKVGSFPILSNEPETKGVNGLVEIGYRYSNKNFSKVSYMQTTLDDIELYNLLVSHNYNFNDLYLKPYIGIVGGISFIKLTRSHINSSLPDEKGREFAFGVQSGLEYKLNKKITLFTQYQYLKAKHTTTLNSGSARSEFIRDNYNNINFGVKWNFNF